MKLFTTLASLALLLAACHAPAGTDSSTRDAARPLPPAAAEDDFCFVFLETGLARDLSQEELTAAFTGHFENMGRLADEGVLLLAGPFAEPKADPAHRGLFVFDVADPAEGERLVATDPAVRAGALKGSVFRFTTSSPMRDFLTHYATAAEELGKEPGMRSYVLVITEDARLAERTIDERPELVIFHGRFGGAREGQRLLCLDATTNDEARVALGPGDWTYLPWYSTDTHVRALAR